jgi:triosephosphate isomerase (TIM)
MAANWKMYKTASQTTAFFEKLIPLVQDVDHCDIVVFPTALCIDAAVKAAQANPVKGGPIQVGGQNLYWGKEGAYTGEISAPMLSDAGATWTLVGHSERRQYFHETDADVLKKTHAAIEAGLTPLVCVGERLEEHAAGKTDEVLVRQFAAGVAGLTEEQFAQVAIAYEPVWAIGTGKTATPEIASSAHKLIRAEAEKRFGFEAARSLRILYGGSVKPDNIDGLMNEDEIDGTLVGGASLDPDSFSKIIRAAQ